MTDHINDRTYETHEPIVDAEDAQEQPATPEPVRGADGSQQNSADQLGEHLIKAATETAYAAVGFVGLVSDKAKEFYEEQKRQYAQAHPDTEEPGAKHFLAQLREQVDRFVDDLTKGVREMADRGRAAGQNAKSEAPSTAGHSPEGFDESDDVEAEVIIGADDHLGQPDYADDAVAEEADFFAADAPAYEGEAPDPNRPAEF